MQSEIDRESKNKAEILSDFSQIKSKVELATKIEQDASLNKKKIDFLAARLQSL